MGLAGMDPTVIADRMNHTDGGPLHLKRYQHLYKGEQQSQGRRLDALVQSDLDQKRTRDPLGR
jgi:hypothetical protein